jgi:hypothetical protein
MIIYNRNRNRKLYLYIRAVRGELYNMYIQMSNSKKLNNGSIWRNLADPLTRGTATDTTVVRTGDGTQLF